MTSRTAITAAVVGLSVVGAAAVLVTTRSGIGTSVDSVAYIQAARSLANGSGAVSLVQHAPLYSFLLAAGGWLGIDPMTGARWLNAATFGLNIFLVAWLIRHCVTHLPWLQVAGAALTLVLSPMLVVHVTALSEPVFLLCTLAGLGSLSRYLDRPAFGLVVPAGLMGLALLARYAGIAGVLTGVAALVLLGTRPWGARLRDAMLFGAVAVVPMAAWVVRNMLVASAATGRELAFHPVGRAHAWQALYTASGWLLIPQTAPDFVRFTVWLPLGLLVAIVGIRSFRSAQAVPTLVKVLALFVITYAAFLAASISFLDANTPLDDRILLPVLAVSVVLSAYVLDSLWPAVRRVPALAYAGTVLLMVLIAGHGVMAAEMAAAGYEDGWGFTSRAWRESRTLSALDDLDPRAPLFSNAPEIIYLHSGRSVQALPRMRFLMSQQTNREFGTQLDAVARDVRSKCGAVVYLRNLAQKAMATETEIGSRLSLDVLQDRDDGVIWGVATCRP